MLFSIGFTPPTATKTKRRQQRGPGSDRRSHKRGYRCQQQGNSDNNKTPKTMTLTKILVYQQLLQLRDADDDNGNN